MRFFAAGGGSFGGGGASGSYGSAQAAAAPIASPGVATPGALTKGSAVLGQASASSTAAAGLGAGSVGLFWRLRIWGGPWLRAAVTQLRRLRWYHGLGFLFPLLIFVRVGLGLTAILGQPRLLLGIISIVGALRLCWLVVLLTAQFGVRADKSASVNTDAGIRGALPPVLLVLLIVGLIGAPMFAAASPAPQWHLAIACAGLIAVEAALYLLPETDPTIEAKQLFGGGSTSARW